MVKMPLDVLYPPNSYYTETKGRAETAEEDGSGERRGPPSSPVGQVHFKNELVQFPDVAVGQGQPTPLETELPEDRRGQVWPLTHFFFCFLFVKNH